MMADLVHQHVGHERAERLLVLGPIIEERAAVEPDHVRELPGRRRRPALREADAAEQAQKIEGAVEAHLAQRLVVRELLHPHDDAVAQTLEARRQSGERLFGETLEISERRRLQAHPRLAFRHHVIGAQYIADL